MGQDNTTQPGYGSYSENEPSVTERESDLPTGSRRVSKTSSVAKQTDPGVGSALDSTPARSVSKPKKQTQRGLSDSKPPKLITKHGLAPPPPTSSPPPPPPDDPDFQPEPIPPSSKVPSFDGMEFPEGEAWPPDHAALEAARDELTPTAQEISDFEEEDLEPDGPERAAFQTSHGGGKNRVSGGRNAARAYVSPSTLAPGHGSNHHTSAVKIHHSVREESYRYNTEPSLLRRRQSSLPAAAAEPSRRRSLVFWVLSLSLLGGFGTGLIALAVYRQRAAEISSSGAADSGNADSKKDFEKSLNDLDLGPNQFSKPIDASLGPQTAPRGSSEQPATEPSERTSVTQQPITPSSSHPAAQDASAQAPSGPALTGSGPTAQGASAQDARAAGSPRPPSPSTASTPSGAQSRKLPRNPSSTPSGSESVSKKSTTIPRPAKSNDELWLE